MRHVSVFVPRTSRTAMRRLMSTISDVCGLALSHDDDTIVMERDQMRCAVCRDSVHYARKIFVTSQCIICLETCSAMQLMEPCRHTICPECFTTYSRLG